MLDTVRDSVNAPVQNEATSYFPKFLSRAAFGVEALPRFDSSCYVGASGYLSTASDLVRFGMGIDGANPRLIEPLHYQTTIDGSRAPWGSKPH